ncbi:MULTISPECIES: WD40/YVTN/BNR-like repeat-containing protein [unclassified Nocardioides]|uniref:WD40/YVTN/BNR-like repeat-containing protein n=1 Tax=unclassified Nocardioides TaxID=2615069 RepID=UPI0012E3F838|nr:MULTISPECIES: hypothetical protein [unclassified Nocardioides]
MSMLVVALTDPYRGKHRHKAPTPADGNAPIVGHIHGIAPAQQPVGQTHGRVLVGTHYGLFSVDTDGTVHRVGDSASDYMAITAAGPGRLVASGHPEPSDIDRPPNLGLIESRDGGVTWEPLSLDGAADFHALEHTPQRTWGIDSATGGLLTSTDDRIWDTVPSEPLLDLAADPRDADRVLGTAGDGRLLELDAATERELELNDAPRLAFIDWPTGNVLLGIAPDGVVWRSENGGEAWGELARTSGEPTAFSVIGDAWYAATSDGLFRGPVDPGGSDGVGGVGGIGAVEQVLAFTQ